MTFRHSDDDSNQDKTGLPASSFSPDECLLAEYSAPAFFSAEYLLKTAPCLLFFMITAVGITLARHPLSGCLLLLSGLCFFPVRRLPRRVLFPLLLFFCLGWLRGTVFQPQDISSTLRLPAALECRIQLCSTFAASEQIREYQPDHLRIIGRIISAENSHEGKNIPALVNQKILLKISSSELEQFKTYRTGQYLQCHGVYQNLPRIGDTDYERTGFLLSLGIRGTYRILSVRPDCNESRKFTVLRNRIQDLREKCAARILSGTEPLSPESRMLLALSLGYGNTLNDEIRRLFIQSGTIHIFAISGLHVGLFFCIICVTLQKCGFPMIIRRSAAGGLTILYVCLTGITPSSIRALGMALLLLYAQIRHRPPLSLNTLGQIGLLSVFYEPYILQNIGFLFSYIIVFFLLCSIQGMQSLHAILRERSLWLPRRKRHGSRQWSDLVCSLLSCQTAWYAGIGISMLMNGAVCIFSPLVNFFLLPLIPVCLILIPIKIGFSYICPAGEFCCAGILSMILKYMLLLAEWGSRLPGTAVIGNQPPESALIFYTGFFMLLSGKSVHVSISLLCRWKEYQGAMQEQAESH